MVMAYPIIANTRHRKLQPTVLVLVMSHLTYAVGVKWPWLWLDYTGYLSPMIRRSLPGMS